MKTTDDDVAHSDETLRQQRPAYIARIAVLSTYCDRLAKQLSDAGIAPVREPKVDEVRPAILAEGVVAEMNRLRAELRICEEDLAAADQMVDDLRHQLDLVKVSQAGIGESGRGRRQADLAAGVHPSDEPLKCVREPDESPQEVAEPILQNEPEAPECKRLDEADPALADPVPPEPKQKRAPRRAKPKGRTPAMRVLAFLVERGSGANVRFITKALGLSYAVTEQALNELLAAGRLQKSDLAGFVQFKAIA